VCGICGQYNFNGHAIVSQPDIKNMADAIAHRGPDDEGYFLDGPLGFGFRRLAIIDIEGGCQPMVDRDNSVAVIFNGEIYNFQSLKIFLERQGHCFRTRSDTEVIVHGFKQWGVDVLQKLQGMFGLAVWDRKKKRLMLARDRAGIKPLYYKLEAGTLYFGSEVRAILAATKEKPKVDPSAVNLFLRYRYTPAPLTLFQGIRKLAPGTRLIVENGTSRVERWWNFRPVPFDPMPTVSEAEETLLGLYADSVKRHLISDVPLGLLLSGGIDSGLLLALMNKHGNGWNTYTVGFDDFSGDERNAAASTADAMNTKNISIDISKEVFEGTLREVIGILEEPVTASSVVPMYHICRRARQDVKVVLMGQGPDELFGGYIRHLGVKYGSYLRWMADPFYASLNKALGTFSRNEAIRRGLYSLGNGSRIERYRKAFSIMPEEFIDFLFRENTAYGAVDEILMECWSDLLPLMADTDELGGFQFLEIRSSLPDELLLYADKLSMAHGLEIRVPYLDHEIIEYAERLSSSFKIKNFSRKWLHRRVCDRVLPKEIVRRKKIGFRTPVDNWFKESIGNKLNSMLDDPESKIYGLLKYDVVQPILAAHRNGRADNNKIIFSLVALEEWMRFFRVVA
jgi:asparagine synthase (glutamine-hydrolysing)